jgi:hypothetical protein
MARQSKTPTTRRYAATTVSRKKAKSRVKIAKFKDHEGRERGHRYAKIIARAWADGAFREKLIKEPASVLREYGIAVPRGYEVKVVSEAPARKPAKAVLFVLPEKPSGWVDLQSRPLTASPKDDWLEGGALSRAPRKPKPKPIPFPCAKCWNGCC